MMKLIKLGLGSVLILILVIVVLWVFFVDAFVENMIETKGTELVGAQVDLEKADVSLFPAGLTLVQLQATDPSHPMTNAVDIAQMTMDIDLLQLLWSKVIVDEMSVEGVQFGTERATEGRVIRAPKPKDQEGQYSLALPSLKVPDVKKIIENEDLETVRLIEALKSDIQKEQETWKNRLKELPGKAQFAKYKQRVKQLKKSAKGGIGGILSGVEGVQSLKKEIEQDLTSVEGAQKELKEKVALLKTRLAQLKTAPQRDVQHLKNKYNLSAQGLANLSQSLFGAHVGPWVHQAAEWYERLKPYLAQGTGSADSETQGSSNGKDIDFLVRLAKVSLILKAGEVTGTVRNITTAQEVFGKPLTFAFSGEKLKGVNSLTLDGTLDHRQPAQSSDNVQLQIKEYQFHDIALSKDTQWPVSLQKGAADVSLTAELQGKNLVANGTGLLTALQVSSGSSATSNPLTQSLSDAISGISQLSVNAAVTGTIDQYDVQLQSDLDDVLQKAAGNMVNDVAARFGQELQASITAKTAGPIKNLKKNLGSFGPMGGDLANRISQNKTILQDLLKKGIPKKILPKKLLPGGLKLPF